MQLAKGGRLPSVKVGSGARGQHVRMQVLGVHGLNPSGGYLIARRIVSSLPRPMPASSLKDLGRYAAATGATALSQHVHCPLALLVCIANVPETPQHAALPLCAPWVLTAGVPGARKPSF